DALEPLLLIGPGYSARALAKLWAGPVYGTIRSEKSSEMLRQTDISAIPIDDAETLANVIAGAHLVISTPPGPEGCPALQTVGSAAASAASISYLSTTGVYGDLDGGWAMEWSAPNPQSERAQRRLDAERSWQSVHPKTRLVRLPGIYGPGRSAFDRLREGSARRIVKPGQVFSRVHVDDIASGLQALITMGALGVYNLCDDEAAPPQDVIAYAAKLIGVPPPPEIAFADADLSPMAQSFYRECKRVSNAKIKAATGWRPLYRTYREGLQTLLREEI
ncbi:MAG: SDR family NAD(P)-dependent oxidoreductase, partial [Pseudomonadota bacterium]